MRVKVKKQKGQYAAPTAFRYTMWRPPYSIERMKWEINPYDDDDFPSVPHADSIDPYHVYKIDLLDGIGTIYYNREKCGHLTKVDYKKLMCDIRKRDLIRVSRKYYREHHPHRNLPIIDAERRIINSKYMGIDEKNKYVFVCMWKREDKFAPKLYRRRR